MEERTDPSTGEWTYRVEKRATDGLDAVVAALRSTPSPPPTDEYACAGDLVSDPWFLLVDADNNAVLPAVPHDQACGGPIDLGLENLQYTTGDAVRMRQQSTAAELASGCPDQWKNEPRIAVHMNNSAAATAPQTVSSPPTAVCTYSGSDEVGDFRGGTLLDSRDAARIGDLLSGGVPGPADDCPIADGFAVVHTADHAWVYVELSGCRRMFLDGGSTYTAPVPDLVNAINGLDLQR